MRLVFLGPPGAGKGTQAAQVADRLGIPHIATGDMLRQEVAAATELGAEVQAIMERGDLVPDDLVTDMLLARVARPDAASGFILDGFPRTRAQAEALAEALGEESLTAVIYFDVAEDEIVRRISGRRSCPHGHVYHVEDHPPRAAGICDEDGEGLFRRDDDAEEVVRTRLSVYREQTSPLVDFYEGQSILRRLAGAGGRDAITARVLALLGQ